MKDETQWETSMTLVRLSILTAILTGATACDSDLQVQTKEVDVPCEQNRLHPDCAETLAASNKENPEEEQLPVQFKHITLDNVAWDTHINAEESKSTAPAYLAAPLDGLEALYSNWQAKGAVCDATMQYPLKTMPGINGLPAGDGDYYLCVNLVNAKRKRSVYGRTPLVHLDRTFPVIAPLKDLNLGKPGHVTADITEANPGTIEWSQVSGPGKLSFSAPANPATDIVGITNGAYEVKITATDLAGNATSTGFKVNWDLSTPVFTSLKFNSDAADGAINAAEVAGTDPLFVLEASGFQTATYTAPIETTDVLSCNAEMTYGAKEIPAAKDLTKDGTFAICVSLSNSIGVVTYGSSPVLTRDTIAPIGTAKLRALAADGFLNEADRVLKENVVTLVTTETGLTSTFAFVPSTVSCGNGQFHTTPQADHTSLAKDGSYKACISVLDPAANTTVIESAAFVVDTAAPTFVTLELTGDAADQALTGGERNNTTDLINLTASGQDSIGYALVASGATCDGNLVYDNTVPKSNSTAITTDGTYKVCVKLADNAGNLQYGETNAITYVADSTAPTPALSATQPSITNQTSLNITVTFDEAVTGFDLSDIAVVNGTKGNFATTSSSVYTFDITGASGAVTVDVVAGVASDAAGNTSNAATQLAFTIDATAPTVASVSTTKADGTYTVGEVIPITVTFDEAVAVTGTPLLTLETGTTDRNLNYASGTGTTTLSFSYTVQSGVMMFYCNIP